MRSTFTGSRTNYLNATFSLRLQPSLVVYYNKGTIIESLYEFRIFSINKRRHPYVLVSLRYLYYVLKPQHEMHILHPWRVAKDGIYNSSIQHRNFINIRNGANKR